MSPFVGDRLHYLITSVANHNSFGRHASQHETQAGDIFREEFGNMPRSCRGANFSAGTVNQSGQASKATTLTSVIESRGEDRWLGSDLLSHVGEKLVQQGGLIGNKQILSADRGGKIPEAVELLGAGSGLPVDSHLAGSQAGSKKFD